MGSKAEHGGNILEMAERHGMDPATILDFSANINPRGMPASLRQAIVSNLALAERYPDIEYRHLHRAIANHAGVPVEWCIAGNGATELIFAIVAALAPRRALLPVPGFAEYRRALERIGCEIIDFQLEEADDFQPTERLLEALDETIDCLFLCTPNNPTGQQPDAALLGQIVQHCDRRGIDLIVDESFIDFLPGEQGLVEWLASHPRLYLLRSLTKFYAIPGLRLGYLMSSDRATLDTLRGTREPWTINAFAALAGEVVIADEAYRAATYQWLAAEQIYLFNALSSLPGIKVWRSAANYLFLRCLSPGMELQQALLSHQVLIRHCANYPGLNSDYYRVAIRSHAENQALVAAMTAVLKSVTERVCG
ncbi:threonine-phosphate decarboxylase CobD [Aeromonas sp. MdU4]|uniref:threonine-phosphate decarboxylase CobD n=1 Tax=Aeromonas sp. MdU4 TaxID=3342819 RepID=UPI0035BA27CF